MKVVKLRFELPKGDEVMAEHSGIIVIAEDHQGEYVKAADRVGMARWLRENGFTHAEGSNGIWRAA